MKSFGFKIQGYEVKREGNSLTIWELDYDGERMGNIEVTFNDMGQILAEAERLQAWHNPTCIEVSAARTKLENARDKRSGGGKSDDFDAALQAYTDVLMRHREASTCLVLH